MNTSPPEMHGVSVMLIVAQGGLEFLGTRILTTMTPMTTPGLGCKK